MATRTIWLLVLLYIKLALSSDGFKIYEDNENKVLLDSYIPAAMQLLAYHLDLLKHETLSSTTIEPPFYGDSNALNDDNLPATYNHNNSRPYLLTTERPWLLEVTTKKVISTTTERPWWNQSATKKKTSTTTENPSLLETTARMSTSTTAHKPLWEPTTTMKIIWWSPPSTTPASHRTTTKKIIWWSPPSTTRKSHRTTTRKNGSIYNPTTTQTPQRTTTKKVWWSSTTRKPERITTKMPSIWWYHGEAANYERPTTSRHAPGIFAPTHSSLKKKKPRNCLRAFREPKSVGLKMEYDLNILNPLPASLEKDVDNEFFQIPGESDEDNGKSFLRRYDDSYRSIVTSAGKKRVPPAKPYVEFLILFDLMKRDAKAAKLENYEGYSKKMEKELHILSSRSSEVQLYYVLKRMLAGHKGVLRDDVVVRVSNIIKDLENPNSQTVKNLRYIPPLNFVL